MCVWRRARAVGRALVTGRARGALAGERPRRPEEAEGQGVGVWAVLGSGPLQHEGGNMTKWQSESDGFRMQPELGSWAEMAARERRYESEWARVNGKLRGIAARRAAMDVEEARLLRYAEELKLWQVYGFGSLVEYMERAMGVCPALGERAREGREGNGGVAADRGGTGAGRAGAFGGEGAMSGGGEEDRGGMDRDGERQGPARGGGDGRRSQARARA